ncbi:MAG: hypothetical protein DCC55_16570 [Chloroflexi bacterium]|nr:MAG: hypothetical protein DCC55_16570 [Chloroflexota bacterium]
MKAMLYMAGRQEPVAVFDEVNIVTMNDNHKAAPFRVLYKTRRLNASKTMLELHRDTKMLLKLEDGREANVILQHNSLDMQGNAVGILRVLGELAN